MWLNLRALRAEATHLPFLVALVGLVTLIGPSASCGGAVWPRRLAAWLRAKGGFVTLRWLLRAMAQAAWGCSSIGRAFDWQSKGRGFESPQPHHPANLEGPGNRPFSISTTAQSNISNASAAQVLRIDAYRYRNIY